MFILTVSFSDLLCKGINRLNHALFYKTDIEFVRSLVDKICFPNAVLAISHSNYRIENAGTGKAILEQQRLLSLRRVSYIHIFPILDSPLYGLNIDEFYAGYYDINLLLMIVNALIKSGLNILSTHIHHTRYSDFHNILALTEKADSPVYFYFHDYYSICKQVNFLKNNKTFCEYAALDSVVCSSCSEGTERTAHVLQYRSFFTDSCTNLIAPSEVAMEAVVKILPELKGKIRVVPHQIEIGTYKKDKVNKRPRVAFLGHAHYNKGFHIFEEIVSLYRGYYDFYLFGSHKSYKIHSDIVDVDVNIYEDKTMIDYLRQYNIDIVVLCSTWPETYSYTYFESYAAGCYVITMKESGNIARMVECKGNGLVFSDQLGVMNFFSDIDEVFKVLYNNAKNCVPLNLIPNECIPDEIAENVDDIDGLNRNTYNEYAEQFMRSFSKNDRSARKYLLLNVVKITIDKIKKLKDEQ